MQLVVEISEDTFFDLKKKQNRTEVDNAVLNGTPLPKGHGRLGDLDKLIRVMKVRDEDNGGEPLNAVDRGYHLAYEHLCEEIDNLLKENKNG